MAVQRLGAAPSNHLQNTRFCCCAVGKIGTGSVVCNAITDQHSLGWLQVQTVWYLCRFVFAPFGGLSSVFIEDEDDGGRVRFGSVPNNLFELEMLFLAILDREHLRQCKCGERWRAGFGGTKEDHHVHQLGRGHPSNVDREGLYDNFRSDTLRGNVCKGGWVSDGKQTWWKAQS